jgi:hypothetical protein
VADLAGKVELHVLPPLCPLTVSSADFRRARELIDRARIATGKWLDTGGDRQPRPERFLSLHEHRSGPVELVQEGQHFGVDLGRMAQVRGVRAALDDGEPCRTS